MSSERPLSPHLQVYKPQLTSVLSITHRMTGVFLSVGTVLFVYWLASAAGSADSFDRYNAIWGTWWGQTLAVAWLLSFNFHLLNGIRHLFWDAGKGLELQSAYRSGWSVLLGTLVLSGLIWFGAGGAA